MANIDSTIARTTTAPRYHLADEHRRAILAGSDSAKLARQIERQRRDFIEKNGDAFGLEKGKG